MSNTQENCSNNEKEEIVETIFTKLKIYDYKKCDKISTKEFLETCCGVIVLIDNLGKAFSPVKYDIQGNINVRITNFKGTRHEKWKFFNIKKKVTKIEKKYKEDIKSHDILQDMILAEKAQGLTVATDALQWLRRGLHFFVCFFQYLIKDYSEGTKEENLSRYLKLAYTDSLERFHGWLGSQLFMILCKFIPYRKDLLKTLGLNKEENELQIFTDMIVYTKNINTYVETLTEFYADHNLETFNRV